MNLERTDVQMGTRACKITSPHAGYCHIAPTMLRKSQFALQTQDFMQNAIGGVVTRASKDVQLHATHTLEPLECWLLPSFSAVCQAVCGLCGAHRTPCIGLSYSFNSLVDLRQDLARWATEVP